VRRGPGDKVEAHSNQNSAREFACPRLTPMPCRWATRLRRSRDRKLAWAVQSCAAQRTGAMAPRLVARESGARGENHRVVFSSHPGRRTPVTHPCPACGLRGTPHASGLSACRNCLCDPRCRRSLKPCASSAARTPHSVRAVVGLRGEQSAGLRPCTPCEGKTTQTPWSLPRAVSSAARAGPRGCVLVRSIARGVIRVQAPVCVGGGRMAAADGGQRERSPALPASSRRSEGPAIRSRPIRIKLCA
jgi:hypothetical protein